MAAYSHLLLFLLLLLTSQQTTSNPLAGVIDHVYVVSLESCTHRRNHSISWANRIGLPITIIDALPFTDIDLYDPPIAIRNTHGLRKVSAGEVGCFVSHRRVWETIWRNKEQERVLILEDDVVLSRYGLERLKDAVGAADRERGIGGGGGGMREWHWMFLRRVEVGGSGWDDVRGDKWDEDGVLEVATPSWGTAAYVVSREGVRVLLTSLVAYEGPLDVMVAELQRKNWEGVGGFVALSACLTGDKFEVGCPENVEEMPRSLRGDCDSSGTQSGQRISHYRVPQKSARFTRDIYANLKPTK